MCLVLPISNGLGTVQVSTLGLRAWTRKAQYPVILEEM